MYQKSLPNGSVGIQVFPISSMEKTLKTKSALEAGYVEGHRFIIDALDDAHVEGHTLIID